VPTDELSGVDRRALDLMRRFLEGDHPITGPQRGYLNKVFRVVHRGARVQGALARFLAPRARAVQRPRERRFRRSQRSSARSEPDPEPPRPLLVIEPAAFAAYVDSCLAQPGPSVVGASPLLPSARPAGGPAGEEVAQVTAVLDLLWEDPESHAEVCDEAGCYHPPYYQFFGAPVLGWCDLCRALTVEREAELEEHQP
jgi:hypothetical protein